MRPSTSVPRGVHPNITEREFSRNVVELLGTLGYALCYKTWLPIHSPAGFPDLAAVRVGDGRRPGKAAFLELKTLTGKVSDKQQEWIDGLASIPGVVSMIVRPGDEQTLAARLMED